MPSPLSRPPPAPGHVRLATASPASGATTAQTLTNLRALARRAATAHRADILLLPEAYVGGYPRGSAFGCVVGQRTAEGRDEFLRYWEQAVDLGDVVGDGAAGGGADWVARALPGDAVAGLAAGEEDFGGKKGNKRGDGTREVLEEVAAETGLFLVTGVIEKAGGSLYCAVVYVCPKRGMIGKRRKVLPTGTERLIWAQGSPRTLQAVSTVVRGVRVNLAAAVCWENYMPLLRQALYAQNINLYLAPTADGRDAWLGLVRTVGVEGRCFVVSSNMCVRRGGGGGGGAATVATAAAAATTGAAAAADKKEDQKQGGGGRGGGDTASGAMGGRRNSTITEDGFEIALPKTTATTTTTSTSSSSSNTTVGSSSFSSSSPFADGKPQRRRKSVVLDEDGNEIALHCDEAELLTTSPNGKPNPAAAAGGKGTTTNSDDDDKFVSRGGSCITNPFGDVLAGPSWEDDEEIIYADVDFKDCIRARLDSDAAGSYSRNDSFKLSVEGFTPLPLPY